MLSALRDAGGKAAALRKARASRLRRSRYYGGRRGRSYDVLPLPLEPLPDDGVGVVVAGKCSLEDRYSGILLAKPAIDLNGGCSQAEPSELSDRVRGYGPDQSSDYLNFSGALRRSPDCVCCALNLGPLARSQGLTSRTQLGQ